MHSLYGWAVELCIDGCVCRVRCWSVSGQCGTVGLFGLWCRVCDGHVGWEWCSELHCVCCWAVQCCIDIGMRAVSGWVSDQYVDGRGRDDVHRLLGRALQQFIDIAMRSVSWWLCYKYVRFAWRYWLLSV